ncbi:MAG TPA: methyltransferase domain-containing protein [Ktedonobacteraceae bacterium]
MIDHDNLEDFQDGQLYDVQDEGYNDDYPLAEQWAQATRTTGGPHLDLACGTGRMALHMAALGYQVTGVDIAAHMLAHARRKAAQQAATIEWVLADARTFQLQQHFAFIYLLGNAWQFLLTQEDQVALLTRVRDHLRAEGVFLFETRNPCARNLLEVRDPGGRTYALPAGGQLLVHEQQRYDPVTCIQHYLRHLTVHRPGSEPEERFLRVALRYTSPRDMETLLNAQGWQIRACYGSWQQEPLTATSPALIYACQRRA